MPDTKIACIIPVKDRRTLVMEAIESALHQDRYPPTEIVVVDDGSKDGTPDLIKEKFPQLRVIRAFGLGPGPARNLGARKTKADVLMFLDSDDIWTPSHVETLLLPIIKGSHCSFGITINDGKCLERPFAIPGDEFDANLAMHENLFRWCSIVPSSFAIRREAFIESGGFPRLPLGEDWLFFASLSLKYQFSYAPVVVTKRRIHKGNLCWQGFSAKLALRLIEHLKNVAKDNGLHNELDHLRKVSDLILSEGKKWKSVQEWYNSLKEHALL